MSTSITFDCFLNRYCAIEITNKWFKQCLSIEACTTKQNKNKCKNPKVLQMRQRSTFSHVFPIDAWKINWTANRNLNFFNCIDFQALHKISNGAKEGEERMNEWKNKSVSQLSLSIIWCLWCRNQQNRNSSKCLINRSVWFWPSAEWLLHKWFDGVPMQKSQFHQNVF